MTERMGKGLLVGDAAGTAEAIGPEHLGAAIKAARDGLRMTQGDLAEAAGFNSAQIVSDIERGKRDVKAFELVRIARALHLPLEMLLGGEDQEDEGPAEPVRVLWRRAEVPRDDRKDAQLRERASRYALLEEWCGEPPAERLPDVHLDPRNPRDLNYHRAGALAEQIRGQLDLGRVPAESLERALATRFGVKIFYDALGTGGTSSAACVRDDDSFGSAILLNADEAPWRRTYSLAHELFHLVTWSGVAAAWAEDVGSDPARQPAWFDMVEKCANSFAAALLLPAEALVSELSARRRSPEGPLAAALRPDDYAYVAHAVFGVSLDALLWRLVNLEKLSHEQRKALAEDRALREFDRSLRRGLRAPRPAVFPERFWDLVRLAAEREVVGVTKLAEFAETSIGEMRAALEAVDDEPASDATAEAAAL